jgi:hypothetical protein
LAGFFGVLPGYYISWVTFTNLLTNVSGTVKIFPQTRGLTFAKSRFNLKEIFQNATDFKGLVEIIQAVNQAGI